MSKEKACDKKEGLEDGDHVKNDQCWQNDEEESVKTYKITKPQADGIKNYLLKRNKGVKESTRRKIMLDMMTGRKITEIIKEIEEDPQCSMNKNALVCKMSKFYFEMLQKGNLELQVAMSYSNFLDVGGKSKDDENDEIDDDGNDSPKNNKNKKRKKLGDWE